MRKAPYTSFGKTKNVPVKIIENPEKWDGKFTDSGGWDVELWIEQEEDWYVLHHFKGKRVRIVKRADFIASEIISEKETITFTKKSVEDLSLSLEDIDFPDKQKLSKSDTKTIAYLLNGAKKMKKALEAIRDSFWTDGETDKEKVEDLQSIAYNTLYEIDNNIESESEE